jgi:hypothetical protein
MNKYIHIGEKTSISTDEIVGIFDIEKITTGKDTRNFLNNNRIIEVSKKMPKTFIVCENVTYTTNILISTIYKRIINS